jgi:NADH-quinone oxidoreductase subunit D
MGKLADNVKERHTFTHFIGPNHPGIEGNYALHLTVEGDTVVEAKTDAGYLHRGFEKLMEERLWLQNISIVCRICVPDPDPNENSYSRGIEAIAGIEVPPRAKYIRTMVLELSRIASHLFTFGGAAATIGIYTVPNWTIADRDRILELFEMLTGGRVYHIYMTPGGVRRDIPKGFYDKAMKTLDYIEERLHDYDNIYFHSEIFYQRAHGIGKMTPQEALEWGVTGPNLRACGFAYDVRKDQPYEAYGELDFKIPTETGGDAYSRMIVRRREIEESISIVRQCLEKMPEGPFWTKTPNPLKWKLPKGAAYIRTESSKGEYCYYVVSDGGKKPRRVHVKGPSTTHGVHVLENLLRGARIEDVSQIMFTLDACPPDIDR